MSIALMTLAWKTSLPAIQKMALLAMCDWANDEGGSLHPSISKVAARLSCSERQAQRVLHGLIDAGWIAVIGNPNGGAPGQSRHYKINVIRLETGDMGVTGDNLSRVTSGAETGDIQGGRRVTSAEETGDIGVTQTVNRTVNRTVKEKKVDEPIGLPDWLPAGVFADFVEYRKSIRKPMNRKAQELAIHQLEKMKAEGQEPADVINQSILNGWQGLFAVKPTKPIPARAGKHTGFSAMDYTQGINDDGSFA